MKTDLHIYFGEKLLALSLATTDLDRAADDYARRGEDAFQPSHVRDYEDWKRTNKRGK